MGSHVYVHNSVISGIIGLKFKSPSGWVLTSQSPRGACCPPDGLGPCPWWLSRQLVALRPSVLTVRQNTAPRVPLPLEGRGRPTSSSHLDLPSGRADYRPRRHPSHQGDVDVALGRGAGSCWQPWAQPEPAERLRLHEPLGRRGVRRGRRGRPRVRSGGVGRLRPEGVRHARPHQRAPLPRLSP